MRHPANEKQLPRSLRGLPLRWVGLGTPLRSLPAEHLEALRATLPALDGLAFFARAESTALAEAMALRLTDLEVGVVVGARDALRAILDAKPNHGRAL